MSRSSTLVTWNGRWRSPPRWPTRCTARRHGSTEWFRMSALTSRSRRSAQTGPRSGSSRRSGRRSGRGRERAPPPAGRGARRRVDRDGAVGAGRADDQGGRPATRMRAAPPPLAVDRSAVEQASLRRRELLVGQHPFRVQLAQAPRAGREATGGPGGPTSARCAATVAGERNRRSRAHHLAPEGRRRASAQNARPVTGRGLVQNATPEQRRRRAHLLDRRPVPGPSSRPLRQIGHERYSSVPYGTSGTKYRLTRFSRGCGAGRRGCGSSAGAGATSPRSCASPAPHPTITTMHAPPGNQPAGKGGRSRRAPLRLHPLPAWLGPGSNLVLDPLDVAAAEGLDLAAQLEVAADLRRRQDAEAVDHGQRAAGPLDDLRRGRASGTARAARRGSRPRRPSAPSARSFWTRRFVRSSWLRKKRAQRVARRGIGVLALQLVPVVDVGVVDAHLGAHLGELADDHLASRCSGCRRRPRGSWRRRAARRRRRCSGPCCAGRRGSARPRAGRGCR